ncbi:Defensin [Formica fusca]
MKMYVFALLIVAAVALALPNEDKNAPVRLDLLPQKEDESLKLQVTPVKEYYRTRRFTCDLLSAVHVEHSACAAHCLFLGKAGGRCNSKLVCVCRK